MRLKVIIQIIFLTLIAVVITKTVDVNTLWDSLQSYPFLYLFLGTTVLIIVTYLKIWRFFVLLRMSEIDLSFRSVSSVFFASQALTPLPGGEASRAVLLKKEGDIPFNESAAPVMLQAYLELFSAATFAMLFAFYFDEFEEGALLIWLGFILLLIVLVNNKVYGIIRDKLKKIAFLKTKITKLDEVHESFQQSVMHADRLKIRHGFLVAFGIACLGVISGGILLKIVGLGAGENIPLAFAIFAYAAGVAIQGLATVTPGGLGFTEGGMTGILVASGLDWPKAFSIIIVYRFITFLLPIIIGLVVIGVRYGNIFKKA